MNLKIISIFAAFLMILGSTSVIGTNISKEDTIYLREDVNFDLCENEESNYKTTIPSEYDLLPESYYEEVNINGEGPWDPNFSYEYIMYNTEEIDESSIGSDDEFDLTIKYSSAWCSPNPFMREFDYWQYSVQFLVWNVGKAYDKPIQFSIYLSIIYEEGEEDPDDYDCMIPYGVTGINVGFVALSYTSFPLSKKPEKIKIEIKFDNGFQDKNPDNNKKIIDFDPGVTIYGIIMDKDENSIYDAWTKCNADVVNFNLLLTSLVWLPVYEGIYFYSLPKNKNKGPFEYTIKVENATIRKTVKTEPLGPYDILEKDIVLKTGEAVSKSDDLPSSSNFLQKIVERVPVSDTLLQPIIKRVAKFVEPVARLIETVKSIQVIDMINQRN